MEFSTLLMAVNISALIIYKFFTASSISDFNFAYVTRRLSLFLLFGQDMLISFGTVVMEIHLS